MSKSHPEQWTIREVAQRPERSLVTALREFATTQIADCATGIDDLISKLTMQS